MNPQPCRLCRMQGNLVFSHIFPEFFYESNYDESHRFVSVTNHPKHRPRTMQKGLRELLLCRRCEDDLSRYETYSAKLLRRANERFADDLGWIVLEDVDFDSFRLFGLSLIWRAHSSSLHMFRAVRLGPHADHIRRLLLEKELGEPHQYGFALAKIAGLDLEGDMIVAPRRTRYASLPAYEFMALGFFWVFIVSKDSEKLVGRFPFVGGEPCLRIPPIPLDKQKLFSKFRRAFRLDS